jgi:hypothetical protein
MDKNNNESTVDRRSILPAQKIGGVAYHEAISRVTGSNPRTLDEINNSQIFDYIGQDPNGLLQTRENQEYIKAMEAANNTSKKESLFKRITKPIDKLVKKLFNRQPKGYVSANDLVDAASSTSSTSSTKALDGMDNSYGGEKAKNLPASDRGVSNAPAVPAYIYYRRGSSITEEVQGGNIKATIEQDTPKALDRMKNNYGGEKVKNLPASDRGVSNAPAVPAYIYITEEVQGGNIKATIEQDTPSDKGRTPQRWLISSNSEATIRTSNQDVGVNNDRLNAQKSESFANSTDNVIGLSSTPRLAEFSESDFEQGTIAAPNLGVNNKNVKQLVPGVDTSARQSQSYATKKAIKAIKKDKRRREKPVAKLKTMPTIEEVSVESDSKGIRRAKDVKTADNDFQSKILGITKGKVSEKLIKDGFAKAEKDKRKRNNGNIILPT